MLGGTQEVRAGLAAAQDCVESAPENEARARSSRSGPSVDESSRRCTAKRSPVRIVARFRALSEASRRDRRPRKTVRERATGRLASCPRCQSVFSICRACDRGHVYCGPTCSGLARRDSLRRARRRHRHSLEGRLDHRDHERARRQRRRKQTRRVGDHGSFAPAGSVRLRASIPESPSHAAFSTRFSWPGVAAHHCAVCRQRVWRFTTPERKRFSELVRARAG